MKKIAALLFCLALPFNAAQAADTICLYDAFGDKAEGMPECVISATPCGDSTSNAATDAAGLRINPMTSSTPVDIHGTCRYIDNTSSESYFVPFKTSTEWNAFLGNSVPGIKTTHCARPFKGQHEANKLYFGPSSQGVKGDVDLPYWRTGQQWPPAGGSCVKATYTFHHSCTENYRGNSGCATRAHNWTETFEATFVALDSDAVREGQPSWKRVSQKQISGPTSTPAQCSAVCINCTPTACRACNSSGQRYNKSNGTACSTGRGSGWCLNGRCQAFFWDVCSGRSGYVRCYKSPNNGNRGGYNRLARCNSCPAGRTTGGDTCTNCPNVWGSGRHGEWSHRRYFD